MDGVYDSEGPLGRESLPKPINNSTHDEPCRLQRSGSRWPVLPSGLSIIQRRVHLPCQNIFKRLSFGTPLPTHQHIQNIQRKLHYRLQDREKPGRIVWKNEGTLSKSKLVLELPLHHFSHLCVCPSSCEAVKMKRSRELEEDTSLDPTSPATTCNNTRSPSEGSINDPTSPPAAKITELDPSASLEMKCSLPPHKDTLVFPTYEEYEAHYHKTHSNRCVECRKNFPSTHLLGVHVEEMHDPFALVKRERGERTVSHPRMLLRTNCRCVDS